MLTVGDAFDLALMFFGFAIVCWRAPDFYRKVQAVRSELTDSPKEGDDIVLPSLLSRAPRFSPYLLCLGLVLGVAACVASARAELFPVAFAVGKQQFKAGDAIVIDEILANSPKFEIGTKVVVRGHYQLASATKAKLGFFVTHRSPAGPDGAAPSQLMLVEKAKGSFELSGDITYEGDPHISFYPDTSGASFGSVYFDARPKS